MNEITRVDQQTSQRLSITAAMATRFNMEGDAFMQTLNATVFGDRMSREEKAAFLVVAWEYRLNPITREIYAMPKKGGGIIPVVSIDGWVRLANEHPSFDGMEFEDHHDGSDLISTTCRIYRKDRSHPIVVTEYLDECRRDTDPWKMKHRMLRHKSMIQCARYAFGFAGIYDPDEAERFAAEQPQQRRAAPSASAPMIEHAQDAAVEDHVVAPVQKTRRAPSATASAVEQPEPEKPAQQPSTASHYDPEKVRSTFEAAAKKAKDPDQLNEAWEHIVGPHWDADDLPDGHPDRDDLDRIYRLRLAEIDGSDGATP